MKQSRAGLRWPLEHESRNITITVWEQERGQFQKYIYSSISKDLIHFNLMNREGLRGRVPGVRDRLQVRQ